MEDYRNRKPIDLAPVIPKSHEGLAIWILKELKCPLPVYDGEPYNNLKFKLIGLWRRVVREFSVANEWHYIYEEEDEAELEVYDDMFDELERVVYNAVVTVPRARERFLELTKPVQFTITNKSTYPKHLIRSSKITVDEMISVAIKDNTSFLFPEITEDFQKKLVLKCYEELLEPIIENQNIRFSVICDKDMGVTNKGLISKYLLVDVSGNTMLVHCYPCSKEEALNNVNSSTLRYKDLYDFTWEEGAKYKDVNEEDELIIDYRVKILVDQL